jgi:hypothetical protein
MRLTPRDRIVCFLLVVCVPAAGAQGNAQCNAYGSGILGDQRAANVCNAAVDGASIFAPVGGILISGGNPFLGATGGLGGFPHMGLTLRVNATNVAGPDFRYNGVGNTVALQQKIFAPAPLLEAAVGLFRGVRHGAFAIDLLASAQLLPTRLIDDVHVDVTANRIGTIALGLGVGARMTLVGEQHSLPAITASVMRRTLPRIGIGSLVNGDGYSFASNLVGVQYRATMGKRLGSLDLGAGAGWTDYSADAQVVFINPITGMQEPAILLAIKDSRALGFVDGGLAMGSLYLIGEAGMQTGKDLGLVTTFTGNDPGGRRFFGSLGLRFGF